MPDFSAIPPPVPVTAGLSAGPTPPGPPPVGGPRAGAPPLPEKQEQVEEDPFAQFAIDTGETPWEAPTEEPLAAKFEAIDDAGPLPRRSLRASLESLGTSAIVHAVLVIALAMWQIAVHFEPLKLELSGGPSLDPLPIETLKLPTTAANPDPLRAEDDGASDAKFDAPAIASLASEDNLPAGPVTNTIGMEGSLPGRLMADIGNLGGGGLSGRAADRRGKLALTDGGTPDSETAVRKGLAWLALHQEKNGSWRFNHSLTACVYCKNAGRNPSVTGATAMGLLPFLGAGQTHQDGEYQDTVRRGLYYLMDHMVTTPHGGDLQDGTMYAHGLCTIVLCEAYALTGDNALQIPAQRALDFIAFAQDKKGGGWRYEPGQPGDTSMLGWQLMALKSGQMAYLKVPGDAGRLAGYFLDSVQSERGAVYGYLTPGNGKGTTAIGLLSRMYLGWKKETPALERGVAHLDIWGPSKDDMYYNYYASQVLHHWGGRPWQKWNTKMRDFLVATQAQQGHEVGSWFFPGGGPAGDTGGRLYNTSLAIMTLEVYYRHMPLYRQQSVEDGF